MKMFYPECDLCGLFSPPKVLFTPCESESEVLNQKKKMLKESSLFSPLMSKNRVFWTFQP